MTTSGIRVSALYVLERGPYFGVPDVDPWPESRDARSYAGPWPVVAHPPCERWGRYAGGGPSARGTKIPGDDGGCFAAALASVRRWGGVLEHPEGSAAYAAHGLARPPRGGGWVRADDVGGWCCCVAQGHYGHEAQKLTWLYVVGTDRPDLIWGPCAGMAEARDARLGVERLTPEQAARARKTGVVQRLSKRQRCATPPAFRDLLLTIARSARRDCP